MNGLSFDDMRQLAIQAFMHDITISFRLDGLLLQHRRGYTHIMGYTDLQHTRCPVLIVEEIIGAISRGNKSEATR